MTNGRQHHAALPAGHKLHWYEIESILGQGGFGITYLARDTNLNNRVAIKEFLPTQLAVRTQDSSIQPMSEGHMDTYEWGLARFLTEARTLVQFKHPNIVQVLTVFEANNTAYMVMEYVEGQSLEDALKFRRIHSQGQLHQILLALLDGVEEIHKAGFIHRDIKPENIYVRGDGVPLLLDFGSARQSIGDKPKTLTALVSPGYAPYEQYTGAQEGDKQGPWTDIYALGATMYRAVTGRGPIDAAKRAHDLLETQSDPLLPAASLQIPDFDAGFLSAIDHALRFRSADRPQSVAQWRLDFETAGVKTVPPDESDAPTQLSEALSAELSAPATLDTGPGVAHAAPQKPNGDVEEEWHAGLLEEDFGEGSKESITAYHVFGLLSFWSYTVFRLGTRLRIHLEERQQWFATHLRFEPGAKLQTIADNLSREGFRLKNRTRSLIGSVYAVVGLYTVGWLVGGILFGYPIEKPLLFYLVVGLSSVTLYINTAMFVLWVSRTLERHERCELLLLQLSRNPRGFNQRQPSPDFIERWEQHHNRVALFLIVAIPILFAPLITIKVFLAHPESVIVAALPIVLFVLAGIFHLWGTRLVVDMFNTHLEVEKSGRESRG